MPLSSAAGITTLRCRTPDKSLYGRISIEIDHYSFGMAFRIHRMRSMGTHIRSLELVGHVVAFTPRQQPLKREKRTQMQSTHLCVNSTQNGILSICSVLPACAFRCVYSDGSGFVHLAHSRIINLIARAAADEPTVLQRCSIGTAPQLALITIRADRLQHSVNAQVACRMHFPTRDIVSPAHDNCDDREWVRCCAFITQMQQPELLL